MNAVDIKSACKTRRKNIVCNSEKFHFDLNYCRHYADGKSWKLFRLCHFWRVDGNAVADAACLPAAVLCAFNSRCRCRRAKPSQAMPSRSEDRRRHIRWQKSRTYSRIVVVSIVLAMKWIIIKLQANVIFFLSLCGQFELLRTTNISPNWGGQESSIGPSVEFRSDPMSQISVLQCVSVDGHLLYGNGDISGLINYIHNI